MRMGQAADDRYILATRRSTMDVPELSGWKFVPEVQRGHETGGAQGVSVVMTSGC